MENDMNNDSNPALIDIYLKALKMQESSGNYQAKHESSIITDIVTGKPIRVQALGAYGILDINWYGTETQQSWAEQAGYEGADIPHWESWIYEKLILNCEQILTKIE